VNHALALELYLKCLLQIEDKEACGHDLDELFAKLNPGHRSRIEQVYDAWIASPRAGMKVADILKRSADAFTKWRYLNEARHQKSPGIYDATLLLPHVRKIIWEDVPQLKAILPLFPNQR
jgi:HEPN domain-containing protein